MQRIRRQHDVSRVLQFFRHIQFIQQQEIDLMTAVCELSPRLLQRQWGGFKQGLMHAARRQARQQRSTVLTAGPVEFHDVDRLAALVVQAVNMQRQL